MSLIKINQQGLLGENYSVLISEEEIHQRLVELGNEIVNTFSGEIPILIGVLNGGFIFLADLIRYINIDCEIDFIRISSYGDEKESSGHIKVLKPLSADIKGRHVVVVEDIVDSGLSVQFLLKMLSAFEPASLRVAEIQAIPRGGILSNTLCSIRSGYIARILCLLSILQSKVSLYVIE